MTQERILKNKNSTILQATSNEQQATNRGFTLIEVIIACIILLILMTISFSILLNGWKYLKHGSAESSQIDSARKLIFRTCEEIMLADYIYPAPTVPTDDKLVVRRYFWENDQKTPKIICYRMVKSHDDRYDVYTLLYPPNYDPANQSTWIEQAGSRTVLANEVKEFNATADSANPQLYIVSCIVAPSNPKLPDFKLSNTVLRRQEK